MSTVDELGALGFSNVGHFRINEGHVDPQLSKAHDENGIYAWGCHDEVVYVGMTSNKGMLHRMSQHARKNKELRDALAEPDTKVDIYFMPEGKVGGVQVSGQFGTSTPDGQRHLSVNGTPLLVEKFLMTYFHSAWNKDIDRYDSRSTAGRKARDTMSKRGSVPNATAAAMKAVATRNRRKRNTE